MALSGTSRGSGTHNSASLTFTLSPASNFAAGLAVFVCAADNSGAGGSAENFTSVTDTIGNTWVERRTCIFDNGAAHAGVQGAFYTTDQAVGLLTTGTTITVTLANTTTAKAWTLTEVSGSVGTPIFLNAGTGTGATTNAPTVTTSSITNANMVVGGLFNEQGTGQAVTQDADATNGTWSTQQTAEIGSTSSGMTVSSQWKTVTATATQTFNPTLAVSSDTICGWIQIEEIGFVTGSTTLTFSPTGAVGGNGALAGSTTVIFTSAGSVVGDGQLSGSTVVVFTPSATIVGDIDITGISTLIFTPSGVLGGVADGNGTSTLTFSTAGTILGLAEGAGAATLTFTTTGGVEGAGELNGSTTLILTSTGTIVGDGELAGVGTFTFTVQAVAEGAGALSGGVVLTFSPVGVLVGQADIAGSTTFTFLPTADLLGIVDANGSTTLSFALTGNLTGVGSFSTITGFAQMIFTVVGGLRGLGFPLSQITSSAGQSGIITNLNALSEIQDLSSLSEIEPLI